ncbi:MAG TPA: SDR family oxidoreductase [Solirubrobacteraceae bacterium]
MIAIAGGHGKIALRLTERLTARGETVVALIRNPDHAEDVRARGGKPKRCDIEHADSAEIAAAIAGAEAVVFAAGAGPGSGAERKWTVDRDGAVKLLDAAGQAQTRRYVIVSSIGTEAPPEGDDVSSVYFQAKAQADAAVQASDLDWTIVRPGGLTDDPGTGRVRIDLEPFHGRVRRDDVAAVIDALLDPPRAIRRILYVNGGEDPIEQAVDRIA